MPHQPPAGLPTPRLISSDCRILLDAAPDAMLVVNREGEVVVANPAAERLFGFFGDEFTGRIVESLLPERFRKQHKLDRAIFVSDPRAGRWALTWSCSHCAATVVKFRSTSVSALPLTVKPIRWLPSATSPKAGSSPQVGTRVPHPVSKRQ